MKTNNLEIATKLVHEHRAKATRSAVFLVDDDMYFAKPAPRVITKRIMLKLKTVPSRTIHCLSFYSSSKGRHISASASVHLQ